MRNFVHVILLAILLVFGACKGNDPTITIANQLDIDRVVETVKFELTELHLTTNKLSIVDQLTGEEVPTQLVDKDEDGQSEYILFQVQLKANESRSYIVREGISTIVPSEVKTFARFVPERTDDYTWENDRVAFRTYGPEAQRLVEESIPGGTLSSGIDCWLKKVDYSIIDKWYAGYLEDPGYYHKDHGEGLDNYHVGPSRGCGGTGVMLDGKLLASKNFIGHQTFLNGPISTVFQLDYAPYEVGDGPVKERKIISIDLGSNLTKYVIYVEGTDTLTAGVTLHDNKGELTTNEEAGWLNYHAPHFGEQLSTAVIADPKYFAGFSKVESEMADESHGLIYLKVIDGKVEFYSGFYWSGSKQFAGNAQWEDYLNVFASCIETPLRVDLNK